jgi:cytochrome c2
MRDPLSEKANMRLSIALLPLVLAACGSRLNVVTTTGDPAAGARDISRLGCGSCHTIPGIVGAHGKVGPSLAGIASRTSVAGQLANQPPNLERWIQHPHSIHPDSLMPELGVTATQSQNIAAYLYSQKQESL